MGKARPPTCEASCRFRVYGRSQGAATGARRQRRCVMEKACRRSPHMMHADPCDFKVGLDCLGTHQARLRAPGARGAA